MPSSIGLYQQYKEKLEQINEQIAKGPDSVTDNMIVAFHRDSIEYVLNEINVKTNVKGEDLQYMLNLIANVLQYVEQRKQSIENDLCQIRAVGIAKSNYQKQMK